MDMLPPTNHHENGFWIIVNVQREGTFFFSSAILISDQNVGTSLIDSSRFYNKKSRNTQEVWSTKLNRLLSELKSHILPFTCILLILAMILKCASALIFCAQLENLKAKSCDF